MKKSVLREYAKLIVRMGANVQKGQDVIIRAGLDQPEFVQMVVEEAYKAKARMVTVDWHYQPLSKIHVRYQSVKTLGTVEEWEKARYEHRCETLPCRIVLLSDDPDGLKGMKTDKLNKANQMTYPVIRGYLENIDTSGKHMLNIINDILDMSRIESGKMAFDLQPHHIPTLLKDTQEIFRQEMQKKDLTFHVSWEMEDEVVLLDRLRTDQVELNLLSNALKYTPEGGSVNYSVRQAVLKINEEKTNIKLKMHIDTKYGSIMDYFQIFLG